MHARSKPRRTGSRSLRGDLDGENEQPKVAHDATQRLRARREISLRHERARIGEQGSSARTMRKEKSPSLSRWYTIKMNTTSAQYMRMLPRLRCTVRFMKLRTRSNPDERVGGSARAAGAGRHALLVCGSASPLLECVLHCGLGWGSLERGNAPRKSRRDAHTEEALREPEFRDWRASGGQLRHRPLAARIMPH